MADRAAYFVVHRLLGRSVPTIFWDELPREPIYQLEYVVRLDALSEDNLLRLHVPLNRLAEIYATLNAAGKLPPRWEPLPKAKAGDTKPLLGNREVHARRYLPDAPAKPCPTPETVGRRHVVVNHETTGRGHPRRWG